MNSLLEYFETNTRNRLHKWMHYFEVYEEFFSRFRGTDVHFLEIGVSHGGSLQMWKEYFGSKARIFGVDIDPACKAVADEQVRIFIGDQADRSFLAGLKEQIPRVDVLLDDGGHTMDQQRVTFEVLYPHIAVNGLYLCEDLCTSYWGSYGGGYKARQSFIEYTKNLIDQLHAWHSEDPDRLQVTDFTRSTHAIHYYDGIVVLEKRDMSVPHHEMTGEVVLPLHPPAPPGLPFWKRAVRKVRRGFTRRRIEKST
jgi:hypothetical protein